MTDILASPAGEFIELGDPFLDDFRNCLYTCLRRKEGVRPTRLQYDIADFLQRGPELGGSRFRFVSALRGVGKSVLTSIYVPWRFAREWHLTGGKIRKTCMVLSATKDRADYFTTYVMDLIGTIPNFRCIIPQDPLRWSMMAFDLVGRGLAQHTPTITSKGIMGRIVGDRSDIVVPDDIEIPQNADTQGQREKLHRRFIEIFNVLKPGGEVVALGTPQTEDSLYNKMHEWGFDVRVWPAEYPNATWMERQGHTLSPLFTKDLLERPDLATPDAAGFSTPTEPTRFPKHELLIRKNKGRAQYALQYMLDTSLADVEKYPLKLRDLIVMDLDPHVGPEHPIWSGAPEHRREDLPCVGLAGDSFQGPMGFKLAAAPGEEERFGRMGEFVPYDRKIMYMDPSGKGKDETAYGVLGVIGGMVFLLAIGSNTGGYEDAQLDPLVEMGAKFGAGEIVVEANFGDGMIEALLTRKIKEYTTTHQEGKDPWRGMGVVPIKVQTQKELRIIDALEPLLNAHRLVMAASVVRSDRPLPGEGGEFYRLAHQLTRITHERGALVHDDRLDALATGVKHLTALMALTQSEVQTARLAEAEKKMWDQFWDGMPGVKEDKRNWASLGR